MCLVFTINVTELLFKKNDVGWRCKREHQNHKLQASKKKMSIVFRMFLSLYDLKQVDTVMD